MNVKQTTPIRTAEANRLRRYATYSAILVASCLIAFKTVAWFMTGSIAVLSSLMDSFLDFGTSILIFYAVRKAQIPPDPGHRFGHSKAEPVAAMTEGAILLGSAVFLVMEALRRFIDPHVVENLDAAFAVMAVSLGATLGLVLFQSFVVLRTRSVAIKADLANYKGDLFSNSLVIGSLFATQTFGYTWIDPLAGILIAMYLLYISKSIIMDTLHELMDAELPAKQRKRISDIIMAHPEVIDFHDLRTRRAGQDFFIELHLELKGNLTLRDAHIITDDVEREIRSEFNNSFVTIHQEPAGIDDERDAF